MDFLRILIIGGLLAGVAPADTSFELVSGGLSAQLVGINDNGAVTGRSCFDGCGLDLWLPGASDPTPNDLFVPFMLDTVPLDFNNANQVLIENDPEILTPGVFFPTEAIFSLSAPPGTPACRWGPSGFGGPLGLWCALDQGFIQPVGITDGFSTQSDPGLWQGIGLQTRNTHGQFLVQCTGDCWDPLRAQQIAGYVVTDPVPEPSSLVLLAGLLLVLTWWNTRTAT